MQEQIDYTFLINLRIPYAFYYNDDGIFPSDQRTHYLIFYGCSLLKRGSARDVKYIYATAMKISEQNQTPFD